MTASPLLAILLVLFQDSFAVVSGQLRNAEGAPAAGVLVAAMRHPDPLNPGVTALIRLTETNSDGRYTLDRLPPGRYDIVAGARQAPTYYPGTPLLSRSTTLSLGAGARYSDVSFTLKDLVIAGRVTESGAGHAAIGAWVTLRGNEAAGPAREALVREDGSFEFRNIASGTYELEARYDDFTPRRKTIEVSDESFSGILLDFGVARLRGRVTLDGAPALPEGFSPGSLALSQGTDAETLRAIVPIRAGGAFDVRLDAGDYHLTLYSLLNDYAILGIHHGAQDLLREPLRLAPGMDADVLLTLGPRPLTGDSAVRGEARDALTNGPSTAERVTLCCAPGPVRRLSALVHEDGSFFFRGVPPGTYTAGMEGTTDFWPVVQLVNVSGGDVEGVRLISDPYVLGISGRVAAENEGNLSSARLSLEFRGKEDISVPTGRGGTFSAALPEGEYHPCVRSARNDYYVKSITAGARNLLREPLRIDGHAQPEIAVTLAFRTPEPEGVRVGGWARFPGVTAVIIDAPIGTLRTPVHADGSFEFLHVLPDCYNVTLLKGNTVVQPVDPRLFVGDEEMNDVQVEVMP